MSGRDVIVIGASAGGLAALLEILRSLPEALPASVFVVIHTSADGAGNLAGVLRRASHLEVSEATDGAQIEHGKVYVPRADHHLLVYDTHVVVAHGPQENMFRPAVDPLFRSAARSRGEGVIGVILSGGLDDGTYGLMVIKEHGGVAIAQHPDDAVVPSMPMSAIQNVEVDHIVPANEIGPLLVQLVAEKPKRRKRPMKPRPDVSEAGDNAFNSKDLDGPPSVYTCPDCGGAMWEIETNNLVRYRCHVGHGYTADTLLHKQNGVVEQALWSAVRALDERQRLRRQMAERARRMSLGALAQQYDLQADEADVRAADIRKVLVTERAIANAPDKPAPAARATRKKRAASRVKKRDVPKDA